MKSPVANRSVLIVQEHLPQFRVGFYRLLRDRLKAEGIAMDLVYAPNQRNTFVCGELDWATPVPIRWFGRLGWQPVLGMSRKYDLVIVQQELKYLVNPALQAMRGRAGPKVAYWGHGRNFQAAVPDSSGERLKAWLSRHVDWWFAYNAASRRAVEATGFPAERITEVMNAIDTRRIREAQDRVSEVELEELRRGLGIDSEDVAVYTGGIYALKRIGFLIEACEGIRRRLPSFHMIVIGDGPDSELVRRAAEEHEWFHWVGVKSDTEKVPYWMLSKLLLMPGGVGLVVLDSFALGVPMVTTVNRLHGPEIDYLESGVNGWMIDAADDPNQFAENVSGLLVDKERLGMMASEALSAGDRYSFEMMADNFAGGVVLALD